MSVDPKEEQRKKARAAMAGEERLKRIEDREALSFKAHEKAAAAMEGPEQRTKRLAREKKEQEKLSALQQEEETKQKAEQMERLRKEETERLRLAEEDAKNKREETKLEEIRHSEEAIAELKKKPVGLSSLRTFKSDLSRAIARGASQASMIAAEEKRRAQMGSALPEREEKGKLRIVLIGASIFFVTGGIGVASYVFIHTLREPYSQTQTVAVPASGLVRIANNENLEVGDLTPASLRDILSSKRAQGAESPREIIFTTASSSNKRVIDASEYLQALDINPPGILTRTLEGSFAYGILEGTAPGAFLLLKIESAPNALSGMLAWEKTLGENLAPILGTSKETLVSGTPFIDSIIKNRDTRILRSREGEDALLYTVDSSRNLIIITRSIQDFESLLTLLP